MLWVIKIWEGETLRFWGCCWWFLHGESWSCWYDNYCVLRIFYYFSYYFNIFSWATFFFLPSDRIFDLDTVAFFLPLPCKSRTKDFLCCFYQEIPIDSLCSAKAWPLLLSSNPWSSFARFLKHYWRMALKLLLSVEVDLGTFWSACLM